MSEQTQFRERVRRGDTIHFVGIGGAGMCALAEVVVRGGGRVTGCDLRPGDSVRRLERMGVRIHVGHEPSHLEGVGIVVRSSAIPADHPELAAAEDARIPVFKRAEALGSWVDGGQVVAVAGTHGKTTTTAMVTSILETAGRAPTGFVGGEVVGWESHLRPGGDELFAVEADEYDRSFHHLRPSVAVITNVEADHLDIYGSLEGVREAFRTFVGQVRAGGTVVACADDPGAAATVQGVGVPVVTYGFSAGSMIRAQRLGWKGDRLRIRVREGGGDQGDLSLSVPGDHNVLNALAAGAAARALKVGWGDIRRGLEAFEGVRRRFHRLGTPNDIVVVDDYAHHPTELRAALATARDAFPHRRLVAVFQPHLFTRTRDFADEFGKALADADQVWVTEVYPAREAPISGVDGALVARAAEAAGAGEVRLHAELESLPRALAESLRPGDLCLTMGAGSIETVGPALVNLLQRTRTHA